MEEYKASSKLLESEERIFLNASNITLLFSTAIGSIVISKSETILNLFKGVLSIELISSFFTLLVIFFTVILLKYFADRQRSIIFASRKVIILRRMLGLSYGSMQLILPKWRIEGADQPLSVKLFPGWNTYVGYPFYILSIMSSIVITVLVLKIQSLNINFMPTITINSDYLAIYSFFTCFLFYMYIYRTSLLDLHERPLYLFVKNISILLNLKIIENFEYVIYRAKLATYETNRQNVSLINLKKILVFIEDKEFNNHIGISFKGIGRGVFSVLKRKSKVGGSTITQQIVRTLFIYDIHKTYRRKIVEILLAIWFDRVFTKKEQLEVYLSSVRFEKSVFGVMDAMVYFFDDLIKDPTIAESFFLIERVSNIRSRLLTVRLIQTIQNAKNKGLLTHSDIVALIKLYEKAIQNKKISDETDEIIIMKKQLI